MPVWIAPKSGIATFAGDWAYKAQNPFAMALCLGWYEYQTRYATMCNLWVIWLDVAGFCVTENGHTASGWYATKYAIMRWLL